LTEVRKVIQQKRDSLNPPGPKVPPSRESDSVWFSKKDGQPSDADWVKSQLTDWSNANPGKKEPEFIIVIERGYHQ